MTTYADRSAQGIGLIALATLPTMAIAGLVPVLPLLFSHFANAPNGQWLVPMILTIPALSVALASAPLGWLADRYGRRPVLLTSLVLFTVCGVLPMFYDTLPAIIASRAIVGIGEAGVLAIGNALMGDYFQDDERQRWLGIQTTIGPIISSGYVIAGGVLATWSWHGPFLLYALGAVVLVWTLRYLPEPTLPASRIAATAQSRTAFPWGAAVMVGGSTVAVSVIYFLQAVQHGRIFADLGVASPDRIGYFVTTASIGTIVGGWWFKIGKRAPVARMLALAIGCYGLAYTGLMFRPNPWLGIVVDGLGQFGGGYLLPTLIAWALTRYPFEHRGRGMGIWAGCFFLGQFLSPPVMTALAHGRLDFLQTTGVMGMICLGIALVLGVSSRGKPVLSLADEHS